MKKKNWNFDEVNHFLDISVQSEMKNYYLYLVLLDLQAWASFT